MKKILSFVMAITLLLSSANIVFAAERQEDLKKALFKKGYSLENIEVFPETEKKELASALNKDPNAVDIKTSVLETDNLAEIESFMSATDEELISMGANPSKIETTRRELEDLYTKNTEQLAKEKNISVTEAKFFKKAIEKGLNAKHQNKNRKDIKNPVTASGSISSSTLTYTQAVTNKSSTTKPEYSVSIQYVWKSVYALAVFNDKIVAAWGGGLNTKNISGRASYCDWGPINGWATFNKYQYMTKKETPQAGIEFTFPQSVYPAAGKSNMSKTKAGYACFTLYQTKKQGYSSKIVSNYCHRVISVSSASIGINASGPSVSLSIGKAWDTSPQRASTIGY